MWHGEIFMGFNRPVVTHTASLATSDHRADLRQYFSSVEHYERLVRFPVNKTSKQSTVISGRINKTNKKGYNTCMKDSTQVKSTIKSTTPDRPSCWLPVKAADTDLRMTELGSCLKVEVAALGSPSLISLRFPWT